MSPTALDRAIFRTLAYFAYFHFPLTAHEVFCWLLAPNEDAQLSVRTSEEDVRQALAASPWLLAHTSAWGVYISTHDCEAWVAEREARYAQSLRKHHKAKKAAWALAHIPGVRAIAVCNSLAWHAAQEKSDIDLFIITRAGRIWSTRMLATAPLKILGMRPGEAKRDPLCLSFFASEKALDLSPLREGEDDWYMAYWAASLRWLVADAGVQELFYEKNAWIRTVLPHYHISRAESLDFRSPRAWRIPLRIPEGLARKVQWRLLPAHIRAQANASTHVVLNDDVLKFHEHDTRASIRDFVALTMAQAGL